MKHFAPARPVVGLLVAALLVAPFLTPLPVDASQMPTDPAEAMLFFEEDVEDWGGGQLVFGEFITVRPSRVSRSITCGL